MFIRSTSTRYSYCQLPIARIYLYKERQVEEHVTRRTRYMYSTPSPAVLHDWTGPDQEVVAVFAFNMSHSQFASF